MSRGSGQTLIYGVETVENVAPTTWNVLPFVSVSLDETPTTVESQTINGGRIAAGTYVTGSSIAGDIETELVYGEIDNFLSALAFNNWNDNILTFGGEARKTISVARGYKDISNYHVFTGNIVNSWTLSAQLDSIISSSFNLMGVKRTPSATVPTGTITPAADGLKLTSLSIGDIEIDGIAMAGVACVTGVEVTFDNSSNEQDCLNYENSTGKILETIMAITGTLNIAWSTRAAELYEKQFKNIPASLSFGIKDAEGNKYEFNFPKILLSMTLPSGGAADVLTADASFTVADVAPTITRIPFVEEP